MTECEALDNKAEHDGYTTAQDSHLSRPRPAAMALSGLNLALTCEAAEALIKGHWALWGGHRRQQVTRTSPGHGKMAARLIPSTGGCCFPQVMARFEHDGDACPEVQEATKTDKTAEILSGFKVVEARKWPIYWN